MTFVARGFGNTRKASRDASVPQRSPQDFLDLAERSGRGRLKVYLGYAGGVGKTYRMLEEAHALRKRGVDIVIGLIETHGRADTQALTAGIEEVPRKTIAYRGLRIEEMDVARLLERQPQVALVDEVAHTNPPIAERKKRYQDIHALRQAGIDVICALNIQHLESLKEVVERATGVTIRETVPDQFIKEADQVVTLDLAVEDLIERVRDGKIYTQDKIPWALDHFFRKQNLETLRELALREVAESVERAGQATRSTRTDGTVTPAKVLVCIASSSPRAPTLLRRGSRLAGRLATDWFVVYVETPQEEATRIDAEAQRHLIENITLAHALGGEVVRLKSSDPVHAIVDFGRSHGVGHIIIGRSNQPWYKRLMGLDISERLVRACTDMDVQIVAFQGSDKP